MSSGIGGSRQSLFWSEIDFSLINIYSICQNPPSLQGWRLRSLRHWLEVKTSTSKSPNFHFVSRTQ
jgi:hypothetical protein